ncbi:unnamed protein product, partial [Prunus brigantina]
NTSHHWNPSISSPVFPLLPIFSYGKTLKSLTKLSSSCRKFAKTTHSSIFIFTSLPSTNPPKNSICPYFEPLFLIGNPSPLFLMLNSRMFSSYATSFSSNE